MPRTIPISSSFQPAEATSISPDGSWISFYHTGGPAMQPGLNNGGNLVINSSSMLDPATTLGSFMNVANFPLSAPVLAMLHVYPPRTRLGPGGRDAAPALGPAPPPGHIAAKSRGPTLVVLTSELITLYHPHPLPGTVVLDTRSSHAIPTESVSATGSGGAPPLNWTINALRCPLGARSYADIANPGPMNSTYRAQRGWLGLVGGSDGVWAGVERDGQLSIIRIDIGLDANNIPCELASLSHVTDSSPRYDAFARPPSTPCRPFRRLQGRARRIPRARRVRPSEGRHGERVR